MATTKMQEAFKNARFNVADNTITEVTKDDELVYSLKAFLDRWDGVEGVTISIGKNADIAPDGEE